MPDGTNVQRTSNIKVLSCDPAMANWGLAKVLVNPVTLDIQVVRMKLIHTESGKTKTVRKSSDDLRRANEAFEAAYEWADWSDLVMAEVPTGSQSSRASLGAGMSIGLLAALSHFRPLIQVSPTEAKMAVTGRKTASKDEMIAWAMKRHPDAEWLMRKLKLAMIPLDANEHLADALAIAEAGVRSAEFRAAARMLLSTMR